MISGIMGLRKCIITIIPLQQEIYINGSNDSETVLNSFSNHFQSTYTDSTADDVAKLHFEDCLKSALQNDVSNCISGRYVPDTSCITVELVDRCIRKLGTGKSCGPDKLMSEHLKYAHPIVVIQLTYLFKCIALHGYVPDRFGEGIIVPIIKDKSGNQNDVNNYRGITLTSVISKLFELIILEICKEYLVTHELQFGFKKNSGCNHAIFVMTEMIIYYLENGSNVFLSELDLTKAFESIILNSSQLY